MKQRRTGRERSPLRPIIQTPNPVLVHSFILSFIAKKMYRMSHVCQARDEALSTW